MGYSVDQRRHSAPWQQAMSRVVVREFHKTDLDKKLVPNTPDYSCRESRVVWLLVEVVQLVTMARASFESLSNL